MGRGGVSALAAGWSASDHVATGRPVLGLGGRVSQWLRLVCALLAAAGALRHCGGGGYTAPYE